MYGNKLAVAIKHNNKVLRETKNGDVFIPFGVEYSIFLKNLNSVRALVNITIDGISVTDGLSLIIPANGEVNIERFIKNNNLTAGNKFKFIERTSSVEKHRGIGVEDGLIRVEYQFEKTYKKVEHTYLPGYNPWVKLDYVIYKYQDNYSDGTYDSYDYNLCNSEINSSDMGDGQNLRSRCTAVGENQYTTDQNYRLKDFTKVPIVKTELSTNDVGITVPGEISEQKFYKGDWFPVEIESHVIVIRLLGKTEEGMMVSKPVTVNIKPKCTSCGRTNKATANFCVECGTGLKIVV